MKSIANALVLFGVAAAILVGAASGAVDIGQAAPDFSLVDIVGRPHRLSDYKGKVVVLEWVNPGCPFVQAHYDSHNMQDTQAIAARDAVVWLQINTAERGDPGYLSHEETAVWLKRRGASSTAYLRDTSGKVGRLYGAQATPHMFIIDQRGRLVYQGAIDSGNSRDIPTATNYVKAALASLKAGKPIEKPVSKSYGCGIHYPRSGG